MLNMPQCKLLRKMSPSFNDCISLTKENPFQNLVKCNLEKMHSHVIDANIQQKSKNKKRFKCSLKLSALVFNTAVIHFHDNV